MNQPHSQKKFKPWASLKKEDIVDIIAPASGVTDLQFQKSIEFVKDFGLTPRVSNDIFSSHPFCSNTDKERGRFLKQALWAEDSKAVWCLRGGYGSHRLLPQLMERKPPEKSKLFIGYSDITSLHIYLNQIWNWPTIHGSVLKELSGGETTRKELKDFHNIIYGKEKFLSYSKLKLLNTNKKKIFQKSAASLNSEIHKVIDAKIIGGNLTLVCSSLGTPWQVHAWGKIIVFEEVDEENYKIDRMLFQLKNSGFFRGVQAVIFGQFIGMNIKILRNIQKEFAKDVSFPVLIGLPVGHDYQRPLPFNTKARLEIGNQIRLTVSTGVSN